MRLGSTPWAEMYLDMFYVYIIYSHKIKKCYKGSTIDLRRRISDHNNGNVRSTKFGMPWHLLYYEGFKNKVYCRREELFLKSGNGRDRIKYLLNETLKEIKR